MHHPNKMLRVIWRNLNFKLSLFWINTEIYKYINHLICEIASQFTIIYLNYISKVQSWYFKTAFTLHDMSFINFQRCIWDSGSICYGLLTPILYWIIMHLSAHSWFHYRKVYLDPFPVIRSKKTKLISWLPLMWPLDLMTRLTFL